MKSDKILFLVTAIVLLSGCEETFHPKVSSHDSMGSHNNGLDCISCHSKGGSGEYRFDVAGTVLNDSLAGVLPNTTIKLYTGIQGSGKLKYTLEGDAYGNFYTSHNIRFGNGLYPAVEGPTTTKYMMEPITQGSCNSCHGVITDPVWSK